MKNTIEIKLSSMADLDKIMSIYESAKQFMCLNGNTTQWIGGYPSRDIIIHDIENNNHYIGINQNGQIVTVFSFIIGIDPTYIEIEDGCWLNNKPYGTIHRAASAGIQPRTMDHVVDYCFTKVDNIRIDTHTDNAPMLNALNRLGFARCGIIHIADGSPRIAFHKEKTT